MEKTMVECLQTVTMNDSEGPVAFVAGKSYQQIVCKDEFYIHLIDERGHRHYWPIADVETHFRGMKEHKYIAIEEGGTVKETHSYCAGAALVKLGYDLESAKKVKKFDKVARYSTIQGLYTLNTIAEFPGWYFNELNSEVVTTPEFVCENVSDPEALDDFQEMLKKIGSHFLKVTEFDMSMIFMSVIGPGHIEVKVRFKE